MTRIIMLTLVALVIGIAEPTPAVSQNGRDLVGTWTLVSAITDRDGNKSDIYMVQMQTACWYSTPTVGMRSFSSQLTFPSSRPTTVPPELQMKTRRSSLAASLISARTLS